MADFGCSGCEASMIAGVEEKPEEERTEQEQALARGEIEAPFAYGPLSDWTGSYCKFCFISGLIGAIVLGGRAAWLVHAEWGAVIIALLVIAGPLLLVVGWLGRFPLLGALLGPGVLWNAGQFGVYLNAEAKQKYATAPHSQGLAVLADLTALCVFGGVLWLDLRLPVLAAGLALCVLRVYAAIDARRLPGTSGRGGLEQPQQSPFAAYGPERETSATQYAIDRGMDTDTFGAVNRVEIRDGLLVDIDPLPRRELNKTVRLSDPVGMDRETLADGEVEPTSNLDFAALQESKGKEGFE